MALGQNSCRGSIPPSQLAMLTKAENQVYKFQCVDILFPVPFGKSGPRFLRQSAATDSILLRNRMVRKRRAGMCIKAHFLEMELESHHQAG